MDTIQRRLGLLACIVFVLFLCTQQRGTSRLFRRDVDQIYPGQGTDKTTSTSTTSSSSSFSNAIVDTATPDPYVVLFNGQYYMTYTADGNRVEMWTSSTLSDFHSGSYSAVSLWDPVSAGISITNLWAPELHDVGGTWYIYFSAADATGDANSHRVYVLQGPASTEDPMSVGYALVGQLGNMPDTFGIDATVFVLGSAYYVAWSSWPTGATDALTQELWIAQLETAGSIVSGTASRLCSPSLSTEFYNDPADGQTHAICEGPAFLSGSGWQGLVYSTGASWGPAYGLNTLQFTGGNPLDASTWVKSLTPLLQSSTTTAGPYSPGHASIVESPSGDQSWIVFHATASPTDGWTNRMARTQQLVLSGNGPSIVSSVDGAPAPNTMQLAVPQ